MFQIIGLVFISLVGLYGIGKAAPEALPRFGTWASRIESFMGFASGTSGQVSGEDYQIELAQIAIHRGTLLPHGPASGTSRNFLPHPYSDMIYAFIIEEWGAILGGLGLILLYLALLFRASRTAIKCQSTFGRNLVLGLGLMIVVQALVNMGVSVRLFPTTGQPLPLVSYGGTSLGSVRDAVHAADVPAPAAAITSRQRWGRRWQEEGRRQEEEGREEEEVSRRVRVLVR